MCGKNSGNTTVWIDLSAACTMPTLFERCEVRLILKQCIYYLWIRSLYYKWIWLSIAFFKFFKFPKSRCNRSGYRLITTTVMCLQIIYIISKIDACLNKILDIKYIYYDTFHHQMHLQLDHQKNEKLQEYFSKSLAFPTQISYNRTAQKNIFFRTTHKAKQGKHTANRNAFWSYTNIPI